MIKNNYMKDKIKWFGRYLGCDILYQDLACELEGVDTSANLVIVERIDCDVSLVKLILKELKDITDDDAIECIYISSGGYLDIKIDNKEMYGFRFSSCYESSKRRRNHSYGDNAWSFRQFNSSQIDFLRSKSYAIGIPKQYYITKEELK